MNTNRLHPESHDYEVSELQGYLGLGMQRQCLVVARRILKRSSLTTYAFSEAVQALLILAGDLRRWEARVEQAYSRRCDGDGQMAQSQMLCFHVSAENWSEAERFLPRRCRTATDCLFSMWTLLELRRDSDARRLYRRCRLHLTALVEAAPDPGERELEFSAIVEAMACYLAQTGNWKFATKWWTVGTTLRPFTSNAWEGLLKLHTVRALAATRAAQKSAQDDDWYFMEEFQLQFPWDARQPKNQDDRLRFRHFERHLSRVLPEAERFRFHAGLL